MCKLLALLIALALIGCQPNPEREGQQYIRDLDKLGFDINVRDNNRSTWLIVFEIPHCGHCERLKPVLRKLAYDNLQSQVKFAMVNCKENVELCKMMRIKSYPTIIFIKNGLMYKYGGPRSEEALSEFVRKQYAEHKGTSIPTKVPSITEEIIFAMREIYDEIVMIFSSGHIVLKLCMAIFLILVAAMTCATFYFIWDLVDNLRKKRTRANKPKEQ